MNNLWVDDIRTPPSDWKDFYWAKTSAEAIRFLETVKQWRGYIFVMSLDHDLGGSDTTRPVVLWCCENDFWPPEIRVYTANPVGREWLEGMIERYKP